MLKNNTELDSSFDVNEAQRLQRAGMRAVIFNKIREFANAGRSFIKVDRSFVSQELLDELINLGYSVTKRPQYSDDPVRITWGQDYCPHAGDNGIVDYVESKKITDERTAFAGFCSDY